MKKAGFREPNVGWKKAARRQRGKPRLAMDEEAPASADGGAGAGAASATPAPAAPGASALELPGFRTAAELLAEAAADGAPPSYISLGDPNLDAVFGGRGVPQGAKARMPGATTGPTARTLASVGASSPVLVSDGAGEPRRPRASPVRTAR